MADEERTSYSATFTIYHLPVQVCYEQWHRDLLLIKRLDDDLSYVSLCLCNLVLFRDFFNS